MARLLGCLTLLSFLALVSVQPAGSGRQQANTKRAPEKKRVLIAFPEHRRGVIALWDTATGKLLPAPNLGKNQPVSSIVFAPNSKSFALGTAANSLEIFEVSSGKRLYEFKGFSSGRYRRFFQQNFAFSTDGKLLAAAGADNMVRIWNTTDGKEIRPGPAGHEGTVYSIAVSPDGKLLGTAATDNTVRLWEISSAKCASALKNC
jgi:WD40 repeat protein